MIHSLEQGKGHGYFQPELGTMLLFHGFATACYGSNSCRVEAELRSKGKGSH